MTTLLEFMSSLLSNIGWTVAEKCVRNHDQGKHGGNAGREQAVIAERVQDESLKVEEPERRAEHQDDDEGEKRPAFSVTKSRQERRAESGEVSKGAESGEGNRSHRRILAAQNILAAAGRDAFRGATGEVFYREINSVRHPE